MFRFARGFGLLFTLLAIIAFPVAAQDSVAGNWVFSVDSPQGRIEMTIVFGQNGNVVTGTAELDMVEATEISDGLYENGVLSFLLHLGVDGQWITVEVEAKVEGDGMVGEAYVPEMGASPFTAKRSSRDR